MEPWLSGSLSHLDPLRASVCYSFMQVREEVTRWSAGLDDDTVWAAPPGLPPAGFQLRHIAGSLDRLCSYLRGEALTEEQMAVLAREMTPEGTVADLLKAVEDSLDHAESLVLGIDPSTYAEFRGVGRRRLPTTVGGLLVHLAEHTQRHLGQFITTVKVLRSLSG